jgi:pyridoxine 5-phosphate synthase
MNTIPIRLGVNIDHVATLRQARGTCYPSPVEAALVCQAVGADGITAHLREDRRHIQDADIVALKAALTIPLNLEMACVPEIVDLAVRVKPAEVCIVPERREELTTEGGLDVAGQIHWLRPAVEAMMEAGIAVSLFVEANPRQLDASKSLGVPYVELHTGSYCDAPAAEQQAEWQKLFDGSEYAHGLGLKVNAGHGINLHNIDGIMRLPHLDTLNIGHSIVARAVIVGMAEATREMLRAMAVEPRS